jgi:ADP-ribose pyrophosphatase YjhB (NUDIX family)
LPLRRLVTRGLQGFWRFARGLKLGAEACVVKGDNQVLLVKAGQGGRWSLPLGIVRQGETLEGAMRGLLRDDFGIEVTSKPQLIGIYAEDRHEPSDQTGLFVVRQWRQVRSPTAGDFAYFSLDELPKDIGPRTAARIRKALKGSTRSEVC